MHEFSLLSDLLSKVESVARENGGTKIVGVKVRLGALSHISPGHFRDHFVQGTKGTSAENSKLDIEVSEDVDDPHALDILLESIEVA